MKKGGNMAFRVVMIENGMDIKVRLENLIFYKPEGEVRIPLSDISTIVIDSLQVNISTRTMASLAEHNIAVVFCDKTHLPIGFYSSYDNHSRISKCIKYQINQTEEFYDDLWKEIVIAKLENQKGLLEIEDKSSEAIDLLENYINTVYSGDVTNREAHGAKVYFNALFGDGFSRANENILFEFVMKLQREVVKNRNVAYYAENANLSVGYFSSVIRKTAGVSPSRLISAFTIAHAKTLLSQTKKSIKEIASEMNFPEQYTFRKYFKQYTGIAPTAYRNTVLQK